MLVRYLAEKWVKPDTDNYLIGKPHFSTEAIYILFRLENSLNFENILDVRSPYLPSMQAPNE